MPNRLATETSPYLLQHQDNPVNWFPWGDEAFALAKELDRPILLSIGYSACHWCHVMAHQTFENETIAAQMNSQFICVKVDREERPDVDAIYMTALQSLTGQGGWPLNIFLTPAGVPFFGGTYWPPTDMGGMPGFARVLEAVERQWQSNREAIDTAASTVLENLDQSTTFLPQAQVALSTISEAALDRLRKQFEPRMGGFSGAPKFPQASILTFLLRHHARTGSSDALDMVITTLDRMADGGIHDQIGGGFSRYSVDAEWLIPHFEKMLYDNAQLLQIYIDAWRVTHSARYLQVIDQLVNWVLREMTAPDGGFFAALDADSEGEEGRFYVWNDQELDDLLTPEDADLARLTFGIRPGGNFEGKNILHITRTEEEIAEAIGESSSGIQARLNRISETLLAHRSRRVRPGTDTKIITGWNGLAISAMVQAGVILKRPEAVAASQAAAERMVVMAVDATGKVARSVGTDGARGQGLLEDHAALAQGLLSLYAVTGEHRWLETARLIAESILTRFSAPVGFYDTAVDHEQLIVRPRDLQDGATPSGTSIALNVLITLHDLSLDEKWLVPLTPVLEAWSTGMAEHPGAFGNLLGVLERTLAGHRQIVFVGGDNAANLRDEVLGTYLPFVSMGWAGGHVNAVQWPVLANRSLPDGWIAAAYLCQGYSCLPPVSETEALMRALDQST